MRSPLKTHGGKGCIANWIVSLMPEHLHYVEPYFGGGSVLFAKEQKGSEVVNDLDGELMNFWEVLRDQDGFKQFHRLAEATPLSEPLWEEAEANYVSGRSRDVVDWAWNFFVRVRQSMAGRGMDFTPIVRTRLRRGMNDNASAWLSAVDGLPEVHARLRSVVILNRPALDVILQQDGPDTLFYLDPPYLHETRVSKGCYGDYEKTYQMHVELLQRVSSLLGKVMLSAFPHPLYDGRLRGWRCVEKNVPNHARVKGRECETIWLNY